LKKSEIQFALSAVSCATQLAVAIRAGIKQAAPAALLKGDKSPVTIADFAIQALVGEMLMESFPEDVLVGEESSAALRTSGGEEMLEEIRAHIAGFFPQATPELICDWIDLGTSQPSQRYWTIDPIDGTAGFLRGDQYAIGVSLVIDGKSELSVLGCPHLRNGCIPDMKSGGSVVFAVKGQGSWLTSLDLESSLQRLQVSDCADLRKARSLCPVDKNHSNMSLTEKMLQHRQVAETPMALDSMAKYAVVAGGAADFFSYLPSARHTGSYHMNVWDIAPGALIVEEAGGRVTDLEGNIPDYSVIRVPLHSGLLISNGLLHDELLAAFKSVQ
jgi:3'(2'), 5'-bisphosphate nucleotidase